MVLAIAIIGVVFALLIGFALTLYLVDALSR
jgi:hypothetical protein